MRPPKVTDCRSWTASNVLLGKIEIDAVVYRATTNGLVNSVHHTKSTNCTSALRDFLNLQSSFFKDGNAKVVGFRYGEDGHISRGKLSMDGKLGDSGSFRYLELEYFTDKCELTYSYKDKD